MANYNSPKCFKNLKNRRFGRLIVLKRYNKQDKSSRCAIWKCKCDCGKIVRVISQNLLKKNTRSCGCLRDEKIKQIGFKNRNKKGITPFNALFRNYLNNAKCRNIVFKLTLSQFKNLVIKNCFYCGSKPKTTIKNYKRAFDFFVYNGIDRINNKKGYILKNVVTCCEYCNRAKYNHSYKDFIKWLKQLVQYRRSCE